MKQRQVLRMSPANDMCYVIFAKRVREELQKLSSLHSENQNSYFQIIETEGGSKPTVSRTRKRPTPSNSADPKINYKDHNKNVVYSVSKKLSYDNAFFALRSRPLLHKLSSYTAVYLCEKKLF